MPLAESAGPQAPQPLQLEAREASKDRSASPARQCRTPRIIRVGSSSVAQEASASPSTRCRSFSDLEASASPSSQCRTPRVPQAAKDVPASPAGQCRTPRAPQAQAKRSPSKPRSSSVKPVRPAPVLKPGLATIAKERRIRVAILNDSKSANEVHLAASICREALKWSPWFRSEAMLKLKGTLTKRSSAASSTTLEQMPPIDVSLVRGADVRAGILTGEVLSKPPMDVFVVPGGGSEIYARCLGPQGRTQVRNFVLAGGGYVGVCAGAFLALKGWRKEMSLNLVDAYLLTHYCKAVRDDSKAAAEGKVAETETESDAVQSPLEPESEVEVALPVDSKNVKPEKDKEHTASPLTTERLAGKVREAGTDKDASVKAGSDSSSDEMPNLSKNLSKKGDQVELSRRMSLGSLLGSGETTPRPGSARSDLEATVKALDSSDEDSQTSSTCSGRSSWDSASPQCKTLSPLSTSAVPESLRSPTGAEASFQPVLAPSSTTSNPSVGTGDAALSPTPPGPEAARGRKSMASGLMRPLALPWLSMRRNSLDAQPALGPPSSAAPPPLVFANGGGSSPGPPGPIAKLLDNSRTKLLRSRSSPALAAEVPPSLQTNTSSSSSSPGLASTANQVACTVEPPKEGYGARFRRTLSLGRSRDRSANTREGIPRKGEGKGKGGGQVLQSLQALAPPAPASPSPSLSPSALPRSATPVSARPGYPTMMDDRSPKSALMLQRPSGSLASTCPSLSSAACTDLPSPKSATAAAAAAASVPGTAEAKATVAATAMIASAPGTTVALTTTTTSSPTPTPLSPASVAPAAAAAAAGPDGAAAAASETDSELGEKKPKRNRDAFHIYAEFSPEGKRLLWTEGDPSVDIRVEMRYHNGPLMGIPSTSAAKSLATFQPRPQGPTGPPQMAGASAVVMEDVGMGRAVLISPHPESTTGQDGYYSLQQDPKPGKQRLRRVLQRAVLLAAAGKEELRWLENVCHVAG